MLKRWLLLLVLVMGTAACQTPEEPELTAVEIVQNAANRMQETTAFRFSITVEGAPAYLDADNLISLRQADGFFVAPDRAVASVRVSVPGIVTNVDVISVEGQQWQTNIATGAWEEVPAENTFDPASLFDKETGLQAMLSSDMTSLQLQETENLQESGGPDLLLHKITGEASSDRLYTMSGGLIGPEPVQVQMWIAPETYELYRVVVEEPVPGADEPSLWQVDFSQFDVTVNINPPTE